MLSSSSTRWKCQPTGKVKKKQQISEKERRRRAGTECDSRKNLHKRQTNETCNTFIIIACHIFHERSLFLCVCLHVVAPCANFLRFHSSWLVRRCLWLSMASMLPTSKPLQPLRLHPTAKNANMVIDNHITVCRHVRISEQAKRHMRSVRRRWLWLENFTFHQSITYNARVHTHKNGINFL